MDLVTEYNFTKSSVNENYQLYNEAIKSYDAQLKSLNTTYPTVGNLGPNNNTPSITFTGNQYISMNPLNTGSKGISISMWLFIKNQNINKPFFNTIFYFIDNSNNLLSLITFFDKLANLQMLMYYNDKTKGLIAKYFFLHSSFLEKWFHFTWTIDSTSTWKIYINGILAKSYNNLSYPSNITYNNMLIGYIGKNSFIPNNIIDEYDLYLFGSIADFRIYLSNKTQNQVSKIYTQSSKTPYSADILNKGITQLYTPIFCNIMPTINNYNTCSNCNFGVNMTVNKQSTSTGELDCQKKCTNNIACTSYSYDLTNGNCREYSSFPQEMFSGIKDINSGYNLGYSYNYNNLTQSQQDNIKAKCALQYTNNIYTPRKEIDLGQCLTIQNDLNETYFKYEPECVYNLYNENGVNTLNESKSSYITNQDYIQSVGDPILDKYEVKYTSYIKDKVQLSNINNVMSKLDPIYSNEYLDTVHKNNNIYGNEYLNSIKTEMNPLVNLSEKITNKIKLLDMPYIHSLETFDNYKTPNNFLKITIYIISMVILIIILYNILR